MKPSSDSESERAIDRLVSQSSTQSSRQGSNEADDAPNNSDGENNHYASLPPTPQSSLDDEDMMIVDDVAGPSTSGRAHAAFHLPTNLEIREGTDYQCPVQDWSVGDNYYDDFEHETCLWRPAPLSETEVNDYLSIALGCFNIDQDRALFILLSSNYDIEAAKHQLARRRIKKERWTEEDSTIFKQGLQNYGKHFAKIKQLLPHKTVKELINFYYDNKKKLDFRSTIDSYLEEQNGGTSNSDDEEVLDKKPGVRCYNCEQTDNLCQVDDLKLCSACYNHFRNYHRHRPCLKPLTRDATVNESVKCPKGMAEIVERFVEFATEENAPNQPTGSEEQDLHNDDDLQIVQIIEAPQLRYVQMLKDLEREELIAKGNCVRLEHTLRVQYEKLLKEDLECFRIKEASSSSSSSRSRHSSSWSYKEKWQALFAFQRYGKDFNAVSEVLETKSPDMVKALYDEMREQIDDMINKTNSYYEKMAENYDFESIVKVDEPKKVYDIE